MEKMFCLVCGKELTNGRTKYCSRACYQKQTGKKSAVCLHCGEEYIPKNANKKYCSRKCSSEANRKIVECVCLNCGETFIPKVSKYNKYCSRDCFFAQKLENAINRCRPEKVHKVFFKECLVCGKLFTSGYNSSKYCSDECRYLTAIGNIRKKYREENDVTLMIKDCVVCGKRFETYKSNNVCCSERCGKRYSKNKVGSTHRKRARHFKVVYDPVNVLRVFERDGWLCQICGKKTPKSQKGKNRSNSPELDHILPMSKGGGHTYDNVQCACRACNGKKGDRVGVGCQGVLFV